MEKQPITVTSPLLPDLNEFIPLLKDIWNRKWLTNNGFYHKELEKTLCKYLDIEYLSLFTNGTLPLITALQALRITGEVITTPYSFVATTHAIWWNGIKPVFVDVDPETGNMNPDKIEAAITPRTTAILPVHVYGNPCDVERIKKIADTYGLKVIYDAAHSFGVKINGKSILEYGDLSTLSFHATKVYNTIEGGALVSHSPEQKQHIDYLKNFGFAGETTVVAPGINSKMDEIRAAYGLLNLKQVDSAIEQRKHIVELYRRGLGNVKGIRFIKDIENVRHNYAYFPTFINEREYGMSRDSLYEKLKSQNIFGRRYFYPLISNFATYRGLESAAPDKLPVANRLANEVICLPIYAGLGDEDIERIIQIIKR
ncbi:MAG: DegT/DnrJ/EryC1/StrS family aminotransferase [Fibrobacteraceae bacterium]|nr:DegT/DnrJ/EryC1/StrS family aminotransferase [Fibrobacteraceae bacterium]